MCYNTSLAGRSGVSGTPWCWNVVSVYCVSAWSPASPAATTAEGGERKSESEQEFLLYYSPFCNACEEQGQRMS